jgi:hypothetical protein
MSAGCGRGDAGADGNFDPSSRMPTPRRIGLTALVGAAAALFAWWIAARPATEIGFLADDYDVGALVDAHAKAHPELIDRVASVFVRTFGDRFEVYRPITLATVILDYARAGADGGAHHATNLVLWVLVALAAGGVSAAFARRGLPRADEDDPSAAPLRAGAFAFAAALGSFAAVESLGWLVAREDLLVALFGLLAWRAQVVRPASILAPIPWLVLAFLSKETAVVLPPALAWARMVDSAPRKRDAPHDAAGPFAPPVFLALLAPFVLLGLYLALRASLFQGFGTKYLDRSYGEWLRDGAAPKHFIASLGRLFAPWNDAWTARHGLPPVLRLLFPALLFALEWLGFVRAGRRGDGRALIGGVAFLAASPALTSPMYEVAATLQQGRTLTLSAATLAVFAGLWFARATARAKTRGPARIVGVAWIAWCYLALWFHLGPFVAASAHARGVLDDLAVAPPGSRIVLLGAGRGAEPVRPELVAFDGAYLLSGGLGPALGPPFRTDGATLDPSPPVAFDPASGALAAKDPQSTRLFVATPPADEPALPGRPRFAAFASPDLAPAATFVTLDTKAGKATVRRDAGVPAFDLVRLRLTSELGRQAEVTLSTKDLAPGAELAFDPAALAAAAAEILRGTPRFILWTAVAEKDGRPVLQQPWRAALP